MKKCLFALLAVIAFAACKQVEPVVEPVLEVSATELSFAAVSDEKVIYVTANNAWSLEADVDWLSFNQDSGEASEDKQMVKVYADDNTVEEARTGKITVTSGKLTKVVKGGATRQESARLGSDEVDERCKFVAVADAARCLTTPEEIQRVCHAAYQYGAASAGVKATDTVKVCDKSAFIESTPERDYVWLAQTPQVFSVSIYRTAAYVCRDDEVEATDDNSMAEYIRVPVKMVACSRENIKITEPTDVTFAEAILAMRKKKAEEAAAPAEGETK